MNNRIHPNRRTFLKQSAALPLGLNLAPARLVAGAAQSPASTRPYSGEYPDVLLQHLARKLNALAAKWDQERSKIRTPSDLEARNRFVRQKAIEMIHGLPEKNPLEPVTVGVLHRDGYRVENVMFQSRPNFWVTGNLYIPASGTGPFPGIISPCGHSATARMYPAYQFTYMNLVKNGFVVLAYDPVGQGERRQYWNPQTNVNEIGGPVTWEHSLPGQLLLLLGQDLTHYRIWDGMRAIDYLLTRPEVDPKKIGCTGQSGGGTLTLFISALDERVQCAAVNEGGTRHRWPVLIRPETRVETGDTEQHFFPAAIYGVDMCDLHVAIAPRPLLAAIENYSPSFNETADHIRERYRLLGVPEKFATEQATDPHGMTMKLRLATANWFCRWFYNRKGPDREPEFQLEPLENLYCTPDGSIRYSRKGDTIFSLILKRQAELPPPRKAPANSAGLRRYQRDIGDQIRKLLRYRQSDQPLAPRHVVTTPRKGYQVEKLEFLSEPGIYIPAWVFLPERREQQTAILYVNDTGNRADGMEFGVIETLTRKGNVVVSIEARGIGETKPPHPGEDSPGQFHHVDDVETVMSYMAWEMNESLFGMRVQDVIRSIDYILSRPDVDRRGVRLIGKGMGALWALCAAALDTRIRAAVCEAGLLSYRSLTSVDRFLHGADIFVPDVLKYFDLPDVAAAVADRPLALVSPLDAMKNPVEVSQARRAYRATGETYANLGVAERFRIVSRGTQTAPVDQYLELLDVT
jgi:cephalosporin-C deacetylase-like acetyl esterase